MELRGKVALITGGAHRVGKAITLMLASAGANVVINYHRSADEAQQTEKEARALGVEAISVACDVADWAAVDRMGAEIEARFGGVDVIVNSADLFERMNFPTADLGVWQRAKGVTLDGPFFVCNRLVEGMLARGGGAIVNIVDLSAWHPWRGYLAHSVTKAALMALTRQLAVELAPSIRVNAVALGPVLPPPGSTPQRAEKTAQRTLLGRWGQPDDVARAVRYLVEADYVTGDVVTVDGGEQHGVWQNRPA